MLDLKDFKSGGWRGVAFGKNQLNVNKSFDCKKTPHGVCCNQLWSLSTNTLAAISGFTAVNLTPRCLRGNMIGLEHKQIPEKETLISLSLICLFTARGNWLFFREYNLEARTEVFNCYKTINSWNVLLKVSPQSISAAPPWSKQSGHSLPQIIWLSDSCSRTNPSYNNKLYSVLIVCVCVCVCVSARDSSVPGGAVWAGWRWGHPGPGGGRGSHRLPRQRRAHIDTQGCSRPPPYSPAGKHSRVWKRCYNEVPLSWKATAG